MPTDPTVPIDLDLALREDRRLRALARAVVGPSLADDAVQDAWLTALCAAPRERGAARAWLARVVERCARMARRAETRRARHEAAAARRGATGGEPADTIARLEAQRAVTEALLALEEPYRTAVLLRYDHDLPAEEIARRTGTTPENARQRVHRGLARLRARLERALGPEWRRHGGLALLLASPPTAAAAAVPLTLIGALTMTKLRLAALVGVGLGSVVLWQAWPVEPAAAPPEHIRPTPAPRARAAENATPAAETTAPARQEVAPGAPALAGAAATWPGRVLDLAGRPIAGVALHGVAAPDAALGAPLATTGDDGAFALPAQERAARLETGPPWVAVHTQSLLAAPEHELMVVAAPAVALAGTVTDSGGTPLEGVAVAVEGLGLIDFPASLETTIRAAGAAQRTTGRDGRFALERLPAGAARLVFRKPGYATEVRPVASPSRDDLVVGMTPIDGGTRLLEGTVWDDRGAPVAEARVGFDGRETRTDAAGRYRLAFPAGARIDANAALWAAVPAMQTAVEPAFGARLEALAGDAPLEQDLRLGGPALGLRGVVLYADGTPCAGAHVFPWREPLLGDYTSAVDAAIPDEVAPLDLSGPTLRAWARTDDEGRFALTGFADRSYRLRVLDLAAGWAWTTEPIRAGQDDVTVSLPTDLLRALVSGRVVAADGTPAGSVRIQRWVRTYETDGGVNHSGVARTTTDGDGRFALRDVPGHGARLTFAAPGFEDAVLELEPGAPSTDLEIVLPRRCQFRVQLHDPAFAAATISLLDAAGERLYVQQRTANTSMAWQEVALREGKSPVLATNDLAATLVARAGARELRIPLRLVPGEITTIVE